LFGTGRVAGGTGIVLAAAPGREGIGPQSLAPMMVFDAESGDPVMIAAATGGAAAPSALAWTAVNLFYGGMNLTQAMDAPRTHHGGVPDRVLVELDTPRAWVTALTRRGHTVKGVGEIGRINAIYCPAGLFAGHERCQYRSDRRGSGMAVGVGQ
jgi:gamma-glutamyltranspeptidase/glutathione hydrolase